MPAQADPLPPTSGTFDVLSYNIAGLPALISSAKTDRKTSSVAIGERIGGYGLVQVQEDFNYHAYLYRNNTHPFRTATSGGAGIGSGLNTLSKFPWDASTFQRVKWKACEWASADCLTPKGFTFMRMQVGAGAVIDVYNVHTNAGDTPVEIKARSKNLEQLRAFVAANSAGNAVLVVGDTNARYTRAEDKIAEFADSLGLTDAWVENRRAGVRPVKGSDAIVCDDNAPTSDCEVVDKILYRGSSVLSLTASNYRNVHSDFTNAAGEMLSDHFPIAATLSWSLANQRRVSDQVGGTGGAPFTDATALPAASTPAVAEVALRGGARLDAVQMSYANGLNVAHGGNGGDRYALTLSAGEYPVSAEWCTGSRKGGTRIFYGQIVTNLNRSVTAGVRTGSCVTQTAPDGWRIAGFQGRSGAEVDRIGVLYAPVS
jgi:endonuclease/exonuclease/phosphatase family metal-dependent hydrolase